MQPHLLSKFFGKNWLTNLVGFRRNLSKTKILHPQKTLDFLRLCRKRIIFANSNLNLYAKAQKRFRENKITSFLGYYWILLQLD